MSASESEARQTIEQFARDYDYEQQVEDPAYAAAEVVSQLEAGEDELARLMSDDTWRALMLDSLEQSAIRANDVRS